MSSVPEIVPTLWFDDNAAEAVDFYVSVFPRSRVTRVLAYGEAGPGTPGTPVLIGFELDGRPFAAINGGRDLPFTEALSLEIPCSSQEEVDHYWAALTDGGAESRCGWLTDRFGLHWQVVPTRLTELLADPDPARVRRVTEAMLPMAKLDLATLEQAAAG